MHSFEHSKDLIVQESGPRAAPAVVYIPGIHGDWTPLWRIRTLLSNRYRLIELSYPHSAGEWTIEDYAARLEGLFDRLELTTAHLLAESFGSLVGWAFCGAYPERVKSLMIAGGFCRSPGRVKVALGDLALRIFPAAFLDRLVDLYLKRLKRRGFPYDAFPRPMEFFPATRTRGGWRATHARLKLIRRTDVRKQLGELSVPVLYFAGAQDWIVPVRREIATISRHLGPECSFRSILFPRAPHPIIPSRYNQVSELICDWVGQHENGGRSAEGETQDKTNLLNPKSTEDTEYLMQKRQK